MVHGASEERIPGSLGDASYYVTVTLPLSDNATLGKVGHRPELQRVVLARSDHDGIAIMIGHHSQRGDT